LPRFSENKQIKNKNIAIQKKTWRETVKFFYRRPFIFRISYDDIAAEDFLVWKYRVRAAKVYYASEKDFWKQRK